MKTALRGLFGGCLILAIGACGDPPPPKDPPTPPPVPVAAPEPAEPTCEAMKDRCRADSETRAAIPDAKYVFTPPPEWEYALLEEATVAQKSDSGPVLVLTSMVIDKAAYKAAPQKAAAVQRLAELVDIKPEKKINFSRPKKRKLPELTLNLWEAKASRGKQEGALLILSANIGDRDIFGIGFAPAEDIEGTQAILAALETFAAAAASDTSDPSVSDSAEEGGGSGEKKK